MYRAYKENVPVKQGDAGKSKQLPPLRNQSADAIGPSGQALISNKKAPLPNITSKSAFLEHQVDDQRLHLTES